MKNQPLRKRFTYSLQGLKASMRTERSFRADVVTVALVFVMLLILRPAPLWWALILSACGLILIVELINTAVEKLIDHLHPDLHETVGIVKDTLSAAVFISLVYGGAVLIAFFWERLC